MERALGNTLSTLLTVLLRSALAVSTSPDSIAISKRLRAVLMLDFTMRLRMFFTVETFALLIADLIFAKPFTPLILLMQPQL